MFCQLAPRVWLSGLGPLESDMTKMTNVLGGARACSKITSSSSEGDEGRRKEGSATKVTQTDPLHRTRSNRFNAFDDIQWCHDIIKNMTRKHMNEIKILRREAENEKII
jgi:hypothetical protein